MSLKRYDFPIDTVGDECREFQCWAYINNNNEIFCKFREFAVLLGYSKLTQAYEVVPDRWKFRWNELVEGINRIFTPPNWQPETLFISEPGIYALMARSNKPFARKFIVFIYEEVLPTIRKTGAYILQNVQQSRINHLCAILEKNETTRFQKDEQISKALAMLEKKDEKIYALLHKIIEDRPKMAVMPERQDVKHELRVYKQKDCYKFVRAQKRNMTKALQRIPHGYEMVFKRKNIPNAINVLNRIKEVLPKRDYTARHNEITTQRDLETIVRDNVLSPQDIN